MHDAPPVDELPTEAAPSDQSASEVHSAADNSDREWHLSWEIEVSGHATAEAAAAEIWRTIFGRSMAGEDAACVFTVTDDSGQSQTVDLSQVDLWAL